MIRTHNRPLKETPDILNSVGVDITTNPFLNTMVDCLVSSVVVGNTGTNIPTIPSPTKNVPAIISNIRIQVRIAVALLSFPIEKPTSRLTTLYCLAFYYNFSSKCQRLVKPLDAALGWSD